MNNPFVKKIEAEPAMTIYQGHTKKGSRKKGSWNWFLTSSYLVFMLVLPVCSLLSTAGGALFSNFWQIATDPIAVSTYVITLSMASLAALFNGVFGFILAWVLVRYDFPGKKLLDAAVDLPFALPTSVAGLTLATVYNPQNGIGKALTSVGIQVLFTRLGCSNCNDFCVLSVCCSNGTARTSGYGNGTGGSSLVSWRFSLGNFLSSVVPISSSSFYYWCNLSLLKSRW